MAFTFSSPRLGAVDVTVLTTTAPGILNLPSTGYEPQLGEIATGWDVTLGSAEFIYLKIPITTAIPPGSLITWTAGYTVALLPAIATSKNTLDPIAVANTNIASSASVQYGWFQIQGQTTVLKTAVQVLPNVVVFASATAGRLKVLASAGGQILGARTFNAVTVTSTTSGVLVYMNRPQMQGQIT